VIAALPVPQRARERRARRLAALAIVALGALALHPLLRGRLVFAHDALEYPPRLAQMLRVLADGHLPPVWAPDLGAGHGQPLFEFAPPLLYLLAAPLHAAGASLANALQLTLLAAFLAGAMAIYRVGRGSGAARGAAVAVAGAGLFAPYLALDVVVRGAFAEALALALAPVGLLALLRLVARPTARRVAAAAVALALLPLAHFPAALLLYPALGLCALAVALASGGLRTLDDATAGSAAGSVRTRAVALAALAGAYAAALLLAAFSWLPALLEKEHVKIDLLRADFLHWRLHLVEPWQLLWSRWGYGLSVAGSGDGMSFMVGPLHLVFAALGLAIVLRRGGRSERVLAVTAAAVALGGAWLATTAAAPLWERLPLLQYLAFPWRALLLPALLLPLLALPLWRRLPRFPLVAMLAALVALNLPHTVPKRFYEYSDSRFAPANVARNGIRTTTREEYEPRQVAQRPPWSPWRLRGLDAAIVARPLEQLSHRRRWHVVAAQATRVEAALFWFPGWEARVDGHRVPLAVVRGRGTIGLALPAGEHEVELALRPTAVRRAGLLASLTGATLALALLALPGRRRGARSAAPGGTPGS
jgi:hypothetical protein